MDYEAHTARAQLEHAIEDAIALLDLLDGDPDCEPSLGGGNDRDFAYDAEGDSCDDEDNGDTEENGDEKDYDFSDEEPSLGAPEIDAEGSQASWAKGGHGDRELAAGAPARYRMRKPIAAIETEAAASRAASRQVEAILRRLTGSECERGNLIPVELPAHFFP